MSTNYEPGRGNASMARGSATGADDFARDRQSVVDREQDQHGGIKIGSAFFG
jgi:hypothetical protein